MTPRLYGINAHSLDPATSRATGRDLDRRYGHIEVYLNPVDSPGCSPINAQRFP